ncbi:MAG TPA: PP0621 family protein [Pseudoduganella sp.]|jgi:uncharacterized protein
MTRFLFWVALALLVYFAIRSKVKQSQRRQPPPPQPPPRSSAVKQVAPPEAMLCCAQCGVYYPASENVPAGGRDYCSPAHAPLQ